MHLLSLVELEKLASWFVLRSPDWLDSIDSTRSIYMSCGIDARRRQDQLCRFVAIIVVSNESHSTDVCVCAIST